MGDSRIFVCVLTATTPEGEDALKRSLVTKVTGIVARGNAKAGLSDRRRTIQNFPLTVEWEFKLTGLAYYAFPKHKKVSFSWWQEQFEDKLDIFDKVERVKRDTDYNLVWEDRTL